MARLHVARPHGGHDGDAKAAPQTADVLQQAAAICP
jgi:hypothetical protein